MQQEDLERRVGTVIRDKWTLVRLLGVGGMAAVYVGMHRIGRRDAIKSFTLRQPGRRKSAFGSNGRPKRSTVFVTQGPWRFATST